MLYRTLLVLLSGLLIHPSTALAGNTYIVTSHDGEKSITYEVRFGGGKLMDRFAAASVKAYDLDESKSLWLREMWL
jgi:hypothetical protein